MSAAVPSRLDHIVVGCGDLAYGVDRLSRLLGVAPAEGGRHPAWGTRNCLVSLGPGVYLELIGPDPERSDPTPPTIFGLGEERRFGVRTWAARTSDLEGDARRAAAAGVGLGDLLRGRRKTPAGDELSWRLSDPMRVNADGLVPFLIDWGDSPHPADSAPAGGRLLEVVGEHPDPERVAAELVAVGLDLRVREGERPAIIVRIETPGGASVEIR